MITYLFSEALIVELLFMEDIIKKYKLIKTNETIFTYETRNVTGTIIVTSNKIAAVQSQPESELINIIGSLGGDSRVESVIISANEISDKWNKVDQLVQKQIEQIRLWAGLRPLVGMLSLPDELLRKVLGQLNAKTLISVTGTCRKLRTIGTDDELWRKLYAKVRLTT